MRLGPFRVLMPSLRGNRRDLMITLCAAAGAQVIGIALPLIARRMVNQAVIIQAPEVGSSAGPTARLLWLVAGTFAGLALLRGGLRWQQGVRGERAAQRILADVRSRMYQHLQRLSQGYFDRRPVGKILVRFIGDANALRTWLARTLISVPADLLMIAGVIAVLVSIRLELLVAAAAPLALLIPALAWINPRARRLTREGRKNQTRLCALLDEHLSTMGVIKATNTQQTEAARANELIDRVAAANTWRGRLDAWSQGLSATLATCAMASVALWGVLLYQSGTVNHGDLLAAVWLTLLLRGPVNRLTRANVIHQRARVAVERISALLNREPEPGWSESLPGFSGVGRSIQLRNLGYRDPSKRWIIRGLNATLPGPALVGVTDENGHAGSVLLELLLRLRRPHEGRIYVDDQDVRRLRVVDIRRSMGWVDQHRRVTSVTAGVWKTESERQALRRWWRETIEIAPSAPDDMPYPLEKWDNRFGQDVLLRVALCCALRRDPPILLIDDPMAGLDTASRERIVDWLRVTARQKLLVAVTSDPRLLGAASEVIDLSRDAAVKPARQGTPDESEPRWSDPLRSPVFEGSDAEQSETPDG